MGGLAGEGGGGNAGAGNLAGSAGTGAAGNADAGAGGAAGSSAFTRKACILPLGDSITQADKDHLSYRYWLWQKLIAAKQNFDFVGSTIMHNGGLPSFPDRNFDKNHEGHWGWRADQILEKLSGWLAGYTPGIVLLHLGSNDAFQRSPPQQTAGELRMIVAELRKKNPDVAILIAKILPTSNAGNNAQFDMLNAVIPALVQELDSARSPVVLVDHNSNFDAKTLTYDGIHPNEAGEKVMAERWFDALLPVLTTAGPCVP